MTEELWSPTIFAQVLRDLNARTGHGTVAKIETFNSAGYNARTLSVVIVMMLYNSEDGKAPTLDMLPTYDLNQNFRYSPDFDVYIDYLRDFDKKSERKNKERKGKKQPSADDEELLARAKCATTLIRSAFILQIKRVRVDTLDEVVV